MCTALKPSSCPSPYPTALSTPFASISLHKAHKLLKSETHGNAQGKNSISHYILVISITHRWGFNFCNRRQMTDQCVNTKSSKEEAKYHKTPLGWAREDAQMHTNKCSASAPGNLRAERDACCIEWQFWHNLYNIVLQCICFTFSTVQRRKQNPKHCLEIASQVLARSY